MEFCITGETIKNSVYRSAEQIGGVRGPWDRPRKEISGKKISRKRIRLVHQWVEAGMRIVTTSEKG